MKFHINLIDFIRKLDLIKVLFGLGIIAYLMLLVKTAWLCDDSYITFRTVDNFINGYGLRWNVAERVQTYTHPLWMLLVSLFYFLTKEAFFTSIIISIFISLFSVYLILFKFYTAILNKIFIVLSILMSKAFIDFSTSGLENSLSHFLFILLSILIFQNEERKSKPFILGILFSMILLNRYDFIFILLPILIYQFVRFSFKERLQCLLGFVPFIIWILFSLLYYGFPLPNTAYAKLNTGIPRTVLISEGINYFIENISADPLTLFVIFLSIFLSFRSRSEELKSLTLGMILYLLYVLFIGGDFMVGRFLTTIFILSIISISKIKINYNPLSLLLIFTILLFGSVSLYRTIKLDSLMIWNKLIPFNSKAVIDERKFYYRGSNLIDAVIYKKQMPTFNWVRIGKEIKLNKYKVYKTKNIGFQGFYAGPECYLIDRYALSDPLRARLPSENNWRIGHFPREMPEGYLESISTDSNKIFDTNLHKYYEKIRIITRGNLFDKNRIIEILKFNFGQYSYLVDNYLKKYKL